MRAAFYCARIENNKEQRPKSVGCKGALYEQKQNTLPVKQKQNAQADIAIV